MARPILYVGLDGPILIPHEDPDPLLGMKLAEYAKSFLHWAHDNFRVRFVTDRSPGHAFRVLQLVGLPADSIPAHTFDVSKTEVMSSSENFYWVDGALIPHELSWLAEHGNTNRFLSVSPRTGVTPEHKKKLEGLIRKR